MEQRRTPTAVTTNVTAALDASGATLSTLAEATDMDGSLLSERMAGRSTFTVDELVRIGGLFRIHPSDLLEGAA